MNLNNLSANQLVVWTALLLGLLAAVVLGSAVGSSDMRFVAGVLALIPLTVIFVQLKTNIWVLIPIGWYLSGRLPWLPLPFTVRDLCFFVVLIAYLGFFAMRVVPWKRKRNTLDVLILVNLAYLMTVYFRNPVGFWAFQSQMVGGRPYFEIILAFGGYYVLSRVNLTRRIASMMPFFYLIPAICVGILDVFARLVPQSAEPLGSIYTGLSSTSSAGTTFQESARVGDTRLGTLNAGVVGVLVLFSRYNPVTLLSPLYPLRMLLFACALGAIFLSGFRSALLFSFVAFMLSALLRNRQRDIWMAGGFLAIAIITLVSLQGNLIQLPKTMQRSLSWLPGDWSEEVKRDADNSSQWRFEMWEWAWDDTTIMRNKIWGQGFGVTLDEMNIIASALLAGERGGAFIGGSDRESFMITGAFHSGPLSTVKFIGIVGFCLYYLLMCYMSLMAWKMCRKAYSTSGFTLALFVGIPIIYEPFNYVFIFGGLDSNYSQLLVWAGLLNMTSNYVTSLRPSLAQSFPKKGLAGLRMSQPSQPALASGASKMRGATTGDGGRLI